jgi:hypothetical protein
MYLMYIQSNLAHSIQRVLGVSLINEKLEIYVIFLITINLQNVVNFFSIFIVLKYGRIKNSLR